MLENARAAARPDGAEPEIMAVVALAGSPSPISSSLRSCQSEVSPSSSAAAAFGTFGGTDFLAFSQGPLWRD